MTDTSLLIDTVSAVLRLHEARAQVAARNIAMHNVPSARVERFDASASFSRLQAAIGDQRALAREVAAITAAADRDYVTELESGKADVSLDALVLELSTASGRYQALSEGVSRQFALMKLAIGGGK